MAMNLNMRVTMNNVNSDIIQHNKLPDLVLDKLMDWIMDGKLHMGEKLNTEELANQLGVSRMPIREALNSLEKMGLAESVPYVGARLVKLTREDVRQIYIARQAFEPVAASHACGNITEKDMELLEKINNQFKKTVCQDEVSAKKVYILNRYYHFTIYSISGLNRICAMIEPLWDSMAFFKLINGRKFIKDKNERENIILEHDSYLEALKDRNSERIYNLLWNSLDRRIKDIPYDASACFDE